MAPVIHKLIAIGYQQKIDFASPALTTQRADILALWVVVNGNIKHRLSIKIELETSAMKTGETNRCQRISVLFKHDPVRLMNFKHFQSELKSGY
jgi:hypothetical protein